MTVTWEPRRVEVGRGFTDRLGYAWCSDCHENGLGLSNSPERVTPNQLESSALLDAVAACDGCHRPFTECPPITEIENVPIEHFRGPRIF